MSFCRGQYRLMLIHQIFKIDVCAPDVDANTWPHILFYIYSSIFLPLYCEDLSKFIQLLIDSLLKKEINWIQSHLGVFSLSDQILDNAELSNTEHTYAVPSNDCFVVRKKKLKLLQLSLSLTLVLCILSIYMQQYVMP